MKKNFNNAALVILGGILLGIAFKILSLNVYPEEVSELNIHELETNVKDTCVYQEQIEHCTPNKNISHVTLTCYQPVVAQCNEDPLTTADGSKVNLKKLKKGSIKWCAVSRDIEYLFPMGSTVKLTNEVTGECFGYYEVHDRMNKRFNHSVDIMIHPEDNQLFKYKNIKIELV